MNIVVLGSGAFAVPTLRWLVQSEHSIAGLITQPAKPAGRGQRLTPTPVAEFARELQLSCDEVEEINEQGRIEWLRGLRADLVLVIAFGQKLGREVREATRFGAINLHASLLPKYRGAAPINWAIVNGEEKTGCTVFKTVERMDAGAVLSSRWTLIKPEETTGELHDRLAAIGVDAVKAALELYESGVEPEGAPQDDAAASKAPKLKKSDGFVRFDRTAAAITNLVRGMTPWPGATARFCGTDGRWEKVVLVQVRRAETIDKPSAAHGAIDARRYVAVKDGFLEILEIKPSSGRQMTWAEYVNGRHAKEGDRFEPFATEETG
ncbi:MAG: methionyl-tRNA formyltransferase [Planctomycetota bacterium]